MNHGYIKLFRSLTNWEWYHDHNATRLLIHLLINVNYEPKKWLGRTINAGSMAFSWGTLSEAVGLSVKQCRTAMGRLEGSQVSRKRAGQYQVVTLTKWEQLQVNEIERAAKGQQKGSKSGSKRATTKEDKEYKESNSNNIIKGKSKKFKPPSETDFINYGLEFAHKYGYNVPPEMLQQKFDQWSQNDWRTLGQKPRPIENWKTTLNGSLKYMHQDPKQKSQVKRPAYYNRDEIIQDYLIMNP